MWKSALTSTLMILLLGACQKDLPYAPMAKTSPKEMRAPMHVEKLRCEYQVNPLGIDRTPPRLSWQISPGADLPRGFRQQAWQILVSNSENALKADNGNLWNSGKVESMEQVNIPYAGRPLHSGERAFWKVRIWGEGDQPTEYSAPAWFEMGMLEAEAWQAQWIEGAARPVTAEHDYFADRPAPLLRKDFKLRRKVRYARAYVTGLGYYHLYVNGQKIGENCLEPAWTDFRKRVFYRVYDVTEALNEGANAVGMMLGNGWYNPLPFRMWNRFNLREALLVGHPKMRLQLDIHYQDGSVQRVASDASWKTAEGPVRRNSVYTGVRYDAREAQGGWADAHYDDSAWQPVKVVEAPPGKLQAAPIAPVRVTETLTSVSIKEQAPGVYIVDMGENLAGRARLTCSGPAGTEIVLRYGELLHNDGSLNPMTAVCGQVKNYPVPEGSEMPSTAWQEDRFILAGQGEESLAAPFTWHGFRYVEIKGFPGTPTKENLCAERMHTDVISAGRFACSNPLFNQIQENTRRTLLGNLHSVQSDCPHREKFGYGGDLVGDAEMAIFNYDMAAFYVKTVQDYADAQRPNGGYTETAPFVGIDDLGLGGGSGPIGWGTFQPYMVWQLYQYYGERDLMREQYPALKKWIALLETSAQNNLLNNGIGDHESLVDKHTDVTGTGFYYYNLILMERIARLLGEQGDAARFKGLAEDARTAFNAAFVDPATGKVGAGTQANQAFALHLGLVEGELRAKVLDALVENILEKHQGHLSTGIFGTKFMLMALSRLGRADVAYTMANQRSFPGWGHMIEKGATTLWEHWAFSDNTFSHNHPMFGSISEWFFRALAGINPAPTARAFNRMVICPNILDDLSWVDAEHETAHGLVRSAWRKEAGSLLLELEIPPNSSAVLYLPVQGEAPVFEGALAAADAPGVTFKERLEDRAIYDLGAGRYTFKTVWE